jgi:CTD small phosphatase-like protein 2
MLEDIYIKDLSRINRDLSSVVLVDNAAYSYCLQLANGIPILPYYDGKDFELSALEGYLSKLEKCEDVRVMNEGYFRLGEYEKHEDSIVLIEGLYLKGQSSNFS